MSPYLKKQELQELMLGNPTEYRSEYAPELLQAVPRSLNREELSIVETQPFEGCDVWHAYELSWLNAKGKPVVSLARFSVDASSPNIVESKSFKLYLNSFNQTRFMSVDEVKRVMHTDLSAVAGAHVSIEFIQADDIALLAPQPLPGDCIDELDISVDQFDLSANLLQHAPTANENESVVEEVLHSHLLKSNCLITNQPDWASVVISYRGREIDRESLLRYLISFRLHNEFHEQCVERIFMDIFLKLAPDTLEVQALYTRRGGLDINPFRSSISGAQAPKIRMNRQ